MRITRAMVLLVLSACGSTVDSGDGSGGGDALSCEAQTEWFCDKAYACVGHGDSPEAELCPQVLMPCTCGESEAWLDAIRECFDTCDVREACMADAAHLLNPCLEAQQKERDHG